MTEATEVAAQQAAKPSPITHAQAAELLQQRRAGSNVSEAARTLGKAGAEARKTRTTEAQPEAQNTEPDEGEEDSTPEDEASQEEATQGDETAEGESPDSADDTQEDEVQEDGPIDLGDGLKATKDEIREWVMLKADHTRKTQALSEERKSFEADRTQRLQLLDTAVLAAQQLIGQPKDPEALIEEYGTDEGMKLYFKQVKQFESIGKLMQMRQQEQAQNVSQLKADTIKALSETLGDTAKTKFDEAVQYVSSKTGTPTEAVAAMLAHPEAVKIVLDGMDNRKLRESAKNVKREIAAKPKVTRPGARVSAQSRNQTAVEGARAKLKSSGSLADAVALLRAKRGQA